MFAQNFLPKWKEFEMNTEITEMSTESTIYLKQG